MYSYKKTVAIIFHKIKNKTIHKRNSLIIHRIIIEFNIYITSEKTG